MNLRILRIFVILFALLLILDGVFGAKKNNKDSNVRKRQQRKRPKAQREMDPDKFLEKFGYLAHVPSGVQHSNIARKKAIKNFQRMVGLAVTGKLNKETREMMGKPRCGVPDMVPEGTFLPPPGVALDNPQNYYAPGYKWAKTDLTWNLNTISNDGMSRGLHRLELSNALKYWSDVSSLTFREVSGQADINIDFGSWNHGDGPENSFDGPGGTLAHAFYPEDGRVHFDDSEKWTRGTNDGTDLATVGAHEFGHALGLGHSNVPGALMAPYYQGYEPNYQLPSDDIMAIQSLYGGPTRATEPPRTTARPPSRPKTTPKPTVPGMGSKNDKDNCTTKFGAVMQAYDGRIYVFNSKWLWRLNYWGLDSGYPVRATHVFQGMPTDVGGAVYSWRTRYTYFFKGPRIWKFYGFNRIQKKKVTSKNYPPGVQAAFIGRDGHIYLFRNSQYWVFDESKMDVTDDAPRPISSMWPGIPNYVESVVRLNDGYIYFFKGSRYRKYDERTNSVLPGYPKDKAAPWMGKACGGQYVHK